MCHNVFANIKVMNKVKLLTFDLLYLLLVNIKIVDLVTYLMCFL